MTMFSITLMMGSTKLLTVMLVIHFISNRNIFNKRRYLLGEQVQTQQQQHHSIISKLMKGMYFLGLIISLSWIRLPALVASIASRSGIKPSSSVCNNAPSDVESPSTLETALLQYGRLFAKNKDISTLVTSSRVLEAKNIKSMSRNERTIRIILSWSLLIIAKSVALASPLYFKSLIERAEFLSKSDFVMPTSNAGDKKTIVFYCLKHGVDSLIHASALGLMIGYGATRLASGFIQLTSEVLLSPVTTTVAEILPQQAFSAALRSASRRTDETGCQAAKKGSTRGGEDTSTSGFARRALDRGLRASNQLLYRSIFNLFPSFIECFCVLVLIWKKTNWMLGLTAGLVANTFVIVTSLIMSYRLRYMRAQLSDEGTANGFAEDALSMAETVASFGSIPTEERRYARALRGVSNSAIKVRRSFSVLKLIQALILGLGSSAIVFSAWMSSSSRLFEATGGSSLHRHQDSIAGTLVLAQALFAQLCAPLDHVGQHFRDCVSAAEDLRELEELKRSTGVANIKANAPTDLTRYPATVNAIAERIRNASWSLPVSAAQNESLKYCLEIKNLSFSYPSTARGAVADLTAPKRLLLRNVSLSIPCGGYAVGLCGPSGSGKSTLLRVLLGLESVTGSSAKEGGNSGSIHIYGQDLTEFNRVPFFSMVGQESDLFRGLTLQENIQYGEHTLLRMELLTNDRHEVQQRALHNAAVDAMVYPVVAKQSEGWFSSVGPRGRLLSGGERQRVCIARALYRQEMSLHSTLFPQNSPQDIDGNSSGTAIDSSRSSGGCILLMDEVTASLDANTESVVTDAIMERVHSGGATALIVAHRLSSLQKCDLILVLKDGEVIEKGSHAQLIRRRGGWYAAAWKLQSTTHD